MTSVLVVDVDRDLTTPLSKFLKSEGYAVAVTHDGEDALRLCKEGLPNIIIMEGLLPKLSGLDLAKKVRELPEGGLVSIILISAIFTAAKYKKQISDAQIDHVLGKPFTFSDILDKVEAQQVRVQKKEPAVPEKTVSSFSLSGDLTETPFVQLVYKIFREKFSGTLRLQNQTTKKLVTFENGEPKFVVSNLEQECLGQLLVRKGRLTPEECKKSLDTMTSMNKRQGETLIQLGLLEPYELEETLKLQAREKFCEIFAWRDGAYLFVPGKVFKKDLTAVDLSIPQLCLRGVKEHYGITLLQSVLNPYLTSPPIIKSQTLFTFEDFKFATWDTRIVQQIKKKKTISEILSQQIARDIDIYQLFLTLYILDLIDFKPAVVAAKVAEKPKRVIPESPFELLGISPKATTEDIQKAYDSKISQTKSVEENEEYLIALRNAFERVATTQGRHDYLVRIYEEQGTLPPEAKDVFTPKEFLEIGKRFSKKKDLERAKKAFQDGAGLFPDEGLLYSNLGHMIFMQQTAHPTPDTKEKDRALKLLIKGAQLSPESDEVHFYLGKAFAADKDYEKAVKEFSRVLEINPKHKEVGAELRIAQMRLEKLKNTSFIKWK